MSKYLGYAKEHILKQTEHEVFKDVAKDHLSENIGTYKTEYDVENKVSTIDITSKDFYFEERQKLTKVRNTTRKKNLRFQKLLHKRKLNKREENRLNSLLLKKKARDRKDQLTHDDDLELERLYNLRLTNENEAEWRRVIDGITKLYYYKDAYKTLKENKRMEWNKDITHSKERNWTEKQLQERKTVNIMVMKKDFIEHAEKLKRRNNPVLIANVTHLNPGGAWDKGEDGPEETIFYRSSYELSLNGDGISDGFYPLVEQSTLYSPKVIFYKKKDEAERYVMMTETRNPLSLPIIACCRLHEVIYKKNKGIDNIKILSPDSILLFKDKIRNILQTALYWGHNTIVFDSFGCNILNKTPLPIKHCAILLKEVIFNKTDKFYKKFDNICFCIGVEDIVKNLPLPKSPDCPEMFIYENIKKKEDRTKETYNIFERILNGCDNYSI